MEPFNDQEEQASNPYRGCQIGACFACGLAGGNTNTIDWRSSKPNPLPMFAKSNEFYTPILLPGIYLPLDLLMSGEIHDGIHFYTMDNSELAKQVVAFLTHEYFHQQLLVGIVPMLIRLLASRCYALLSWLSIGEYTSSVWQSLLDHNNNIADIFKTIAPLHEVVANMGTLTNLLDYGYNEDISNKSLNSYYKIYGENFPKILRDFNFILERLGKWFGSDSIQHFTIITLAEFILMGTIDLSQVEDDLLTPPPLIPEAHLQSHVNRVGLPYFSLDYLLPPPLYIKFYKYGVYNITERLEAIASGIRNAKPRVRKKHAETKLEQILCMAKAIPEFHEWLKYHDVNHWLKRRILNGISDSEVMVKHSGFDLPLIESWQYDLSPFISVSFINESTNRPTCVAFGEEREEYVTKMEKHILSGNLIAYYVQSGKPLGIWYAPGCDEVTRAPVAPIVHVLGENNSAVQYYFGRLCNLSVFESLRQQVGEGNGISCFLRHQFHGGCCGRSKLLWSIYEAGMKAREDLGWQPTHWEEPECSKRDNN